MPMHIEVTFDGSVFRPTGPLPPDLQPETKAVVTVDDPAAEDEGPIGEPGSLLRVLAEANLQGPPDWASNPQKYERGPHGG